MFNTKSKYSDFFLSYCTEVCSFSCHVCFMSAFRGELCLLFLNYVSFSSLCQPMVKVTVLNKHKKVTTVFEGAAISQSQK